MPQLSKLRSWALVGGFSLVALTFAQSHLRRRLSSSAAAKRHAAQNLEPKVYEQKEEVTRDKLVDGALASPRLVGIHDKEGWTNLFASSGIIEDPVGSPPSGPSAEERSLFYDTFIELNNVTLNPTGADIVAVERRIVVRRVSIDAQFPNGATMRVPLHIVYRFDASMRVKSLMAHWEIIQNRPVLSGIGDVMPALVASTKAFVRIGTIRGLQYLLWYLGGTMLTGAGRQEKDIVRQFSAAIAGNTVEMMSDVFLASGGITLPVQNLDYNPIDFLSKAGVERLDVSSLRAGGEFVSCDVVALFRNGESKAGVGVFEFSTKRPGKVAKAELFWE